MQDEGVAIYIGPSRALASARTATKRRLLACGGKNRFVLGVRVPNKRWQGERNAASGPKNMFAS